MLSNLFRQEAITFGAWLFKSSNLVCFFSMLFPFRTKVLQNFISLVQLNRFYHLVKPPTHRSAMHSDKFLRYLIRSFLFLILLRRVSCVSNSSNPITLWCVLEISCLFFLILGRSLLFVSIFLQTYLFSSVFSASFSTTKFRLSQAICSSGEDSQASNALREDWYDLTVQFAIYSCASK